MNNKRIIIWGILKRISIGLCILFAIYFFLGAPMMISGVSMDPNLHDKELAWIDKIRYLIYKPQRGEVVVFRFPGTRTDLYVKRIIGLPGEKIEIKNQQIYVNNEILQEIYLDENTIPLNFSSIKLGQNEFFVLGDNRDESNDSRIWGPLNQKFILGKLDFVFWPLGAKHFIFTPGYNI